jgi:hypothetical protein
MSMITTTHPGFESRPLCGVTATKSHWGFWSSLGWIVLALTVASVGLFLLSLAYYKLSDLSGIVVGGHILGSLGYAAFSAIAVIVIAVAAAGRADWRSYLGLVRPQWRFVALGFAVLAVEATFNVGLFYLLPIPDDTSPGMVSASAS